MAQLETNIGTISEWGHHEKEGKREQCPLCQAMQGSAQLSGPWPVGEMGEKLHIW